MDRCTEPYAARAVHPLAPWQLGGVRFKVYGIAYRGDAPGEPLVSAARDATTRVARDRLPSLHHYGVGFVGIHQGKTGSLVFVDEWADENELHHQLFVSTSDRPGDLEDVTGSNLTACVWDLAVLCHERQAWIDCVLAGDGPPDLDRYLERYLERYLDARV